MPLLGFGLLSKIAKRAIFSAGERANIDFHVLKLMAVTARVTLVIFGLITALGTLGVNVSALVASLGLTGFALGFAVKDTISNLLAGVLLLIYRPFRVEDQIKVKGLSGRVLSIDLRYTTLAGPAQRVLVPNSILFTDPITVGEGESQV